MRTHYDNLQVVQNAFPSVIKNAYRALAQEWHPDKRPDNTEEATRKLKIINQAYKILSNPAKRKKHDEWIAGQERKNDQQRGPQYEDESNRASNGRNKKQTSSSSSPDNQASQTNQRGWATGATEQSSRRTRRSREKRIASSQVWRKRMLYALIPSLGGFLIANLTGEEFLPYSLRVVVGFVGLATGWMTIIFLVRWIWARLW